MLIEKGMLTVSRYINISIKREIKRWFLILSTETVIETRTFMKLQTYSDDRATS